MNDFHNFVLVLHYAIPCAPIFRDELAGVKKTHVVFKFCYNFDYFIFDYFRKERGKERKREGRKKGRKEGRKERRKEGKREGKKEGQKGKKNREREAEEGKQGCVEKPQP